MNALPARDQIIEQYPGTQISRQAHAVIEAKKQDIRIQDNHSSNGVKVNGEKVGAKTLADGDQIELGRVVMSFHLVCREPEQDDDKTYILES